MSSNAALETEAPTNELVYLDGFVPSTFDAPHSSLQRSATWIGMGLILVSLAGFGAFVYGFGVGSDDTSPMAADGTVIGIAGLIVGFVLLFGGFFLVHMGRANYRAYKKDSGRVQ